MCQTNTLPSEWWVWLGGWPVLGGMRQRPPSAPRYDEARTPLCVPRLGSKPNFRVGGHYLENGFISASQALFTNTCFRKADLTLIVVCKARCSAVMFRRVWFDLGWRQMGIIISWAVINFCCRREVVRKRRKMPIFKTHPVVPRWSELQFLAQLCHGLRGTVYSDVGQPWPWES